MGFNFDDHNLADLMAKLSLISLSEIGGMKRNTYAMFDNKFVGDSYFVEMDQILKAIY